MERRNKGLVIVVAVLAVAVTAMAIGFAALSTTLTINGDVNVKPAKWDIHFDDSSYEDISVLGINNGNTHGTSVADRTTAGTNLLIADEPTITETTVDWEATLYEIGDKASFNVTIVNDGDYDAVLSSITSTSDKSDATTDSYLEYTVTIDGNEYTIGTDTSGDVEIAAGDSITCTVTAEYVRPSDNTKLPQVDTKVHLTTTLVFEPKTA